MKREVENESDWGIKFVRDVVNLTLHLLKRGSERTENFEKYGKEDDIK